MPITTESAKKWFSPFTTYQRELELKLPEDTKGRARVLLGGIYRMATGRVNRSWHLPSKFKWLNKPEDGHQNHLGFFDYCTFGIFNAVETFCLGNWLHKVKGIKDVEKASKILAAATGVIWVPMNALRVAFGVMVVVVAAAAAVAIGLPIAMGAGIIYGIYRGIQRFANWVKSRSKATQHQLEAELKDYAGSYAEADIDEELKPAFHLATSQSSLHLPKNQNNEPNHSELPPTGKKFYYEVTETTTRVKVTTEAGVEQEETGTFFTAQCKPITHLATRYKEVSDFKVRENSEFQKLSSYKRLFLGDKSRKVATKPDVDPAIQQKTYALVLH